MAQVDTHRRLLAHVIGACALALTLPPSPAEACSWDCLPGYFLPRTGSTIPANAPVLVWRAGHGGVAGDASADQLRLERSDLEDAGGPAFHVVDKQGETWLELDDPLVEGARYRLRQEGECAAPAVEFLVGPPAALPMTLGVLTLSAATTRAVPVATVSGSCSTPVAAVATSTGVELSSDAEPWADLLSFRPVVDGEVFRPRPSLMPESLPSTAEFTLYAECPALYPPDRVRDDGAESDQGLMQGQHQVMLEAQLAGVEEPLSTPARPVTLTCPSRGAVPGAGEAKDSAQTDAGESTDPTADSGGSTGGCSLGAAARGATPSVVFALLGLAWSQRRRRHRSAGAR